MPIDIESIVFECVESRRFGIHLELLLDFEHAGAGYQNAHFTLDVEADYAGLSFVIPRWNKPDQVRARYRLLRNGPCRR